MGSSLERNLSPESLVVQPARSENALSVRKIFIAALPAGCFYRLRPKKGALTADGNVAVDYVATRLGALETDLDGSDALSLPDVLFQKSSLISEKSGYYTLIRHGLLVQRKGRVFFFPDCSFFMFLGRNQIEAVLYQVSVAKPDFLYQASPTDAFADITLRMFNDNQRRAGLPQLEVITDKAEELIGGDVREGVASAFQGSAKHNEEPGRFRSEMAALHTCLLIKISFLQASLGRLKTVAITKELLENFSLEQLQYFSELFEAIGEIFASRHTPPALAAFMAAKVLNFQRLIGEAAEVRSERAAMAVTADDIITRTVIRSMRKYQMMLKLQQKLSEITGSSSGDLVSDIETFSLPELLSTLSVQDIIQLAAKVRHMEKAIESYGEKLSRTSRDMIWEEFRRLDELVAEAVRAKAKP